MSARATAAFAILLATTAIAADDPLAGLVLEDGAGIARALDELAGTPVLVVLADRRASPQANAWGERLAPRAPALAPWRAPAKVAWLSVVDARGVPEYARDAARTRIRDQESADPRRRERLTLLIDWRGSLAERLGAERGRALVVLLSAGHVPFARASGEPTDDAVDRIVDAVSGAAGR